MIVSSGTNPAGRELQRQRCEDSCYDREAQRRESAEAAVRERYHFVQRYLDWRAQERRNIRLYEFNGRPAKWRRPDRPTIKRYCRYLAARGAGLFPEQLARWIRQCRRERGEYLAVQNRNVN
jgi:hypothetical protein